MNANKQSNENKSDNTVISDEQKIRLTVKKSLEAFYAAEEKKILSYHEFLWTQLKVIEKKWWLFQFLLLFCLCIIIRHFSYPGILEKPFKQIYGNRSCFLFFLKTGVCSKNTIVWHCRYSFIDCVLRCRNRWSAF